MQTLRSQLTELVSRAFEAAGVAPEYGQVRTSDRPDLGQFQCNGALAAAGPLGRNPRRLAETVSDSLRSHPAFSQIAVAGPGFINLTLTDEFLAAHLRTMADHSRLGCPPTGATRRILVDYGGANVAKPMHVGHLRAAIIGESLKRLGRFQGHHVLGDVHLGDWGLPMGMLISELARRRPDLPYFGEDDRRDYPSASPVTLADLAELYPAASRRCAADPVALEAARQATLELQEGRAGYVALWRHFVEISVVELRRDYHDLDVEFDLWLGESDAHPRIAPLLEWLKAEGSARTSDGALVVDVADEEDERPLPPLILEKSDGAVLYGTTDLATLVQRLEELGTQLVLYVVDKRQSTHFEQLFRAAYRTGLVPSSVELEHIGFGTMNGPDGKPFKTRAGGVMTLRSLIDLVVEKADQRIDEAGLGVDYDTEERQRIAHMVGIATLKFADLANQRSADYLFDLDRFSAFEGRTGPYLLYSAARIQSILRNAAAVGLAIGPLDMPHSSTERSLWLRLTELPDAVALSWQERAPHHLCEFAYQTAVAFNRFYDRHHILREPNPVSQSSWLGLASLTLAVLSRALDLLGIPVPERM